MNNKKIIIAVILSIGALMSLTYGFISTPKPKKKAEPGVSSVSSLPRIIPQKRRTKRTEHREWDRNPFVPGKVIVKEEKLRLVLNGIMGAANNLKAVINNEMIGVGDEIEGYEVVEITPSKVVLKKGTKTRVLDLKR